MPSRHIECKLLPVPFRTSSTSSFSSPANALENCLRNWLDVVEMLSPEDREYCQDITTQLLDRILYDCDELGLEMGCHAHLDSRRWKKLQTHTDVTLYADRGPNAAWLPVMSREEWENPVAVVAVGDLKCSLDDVLLAMVTPDLATQRLRSELMSHRPAANCRYDSIVRPTNAAPFQSLAVTRFVNTHHWPFTMFVGPRESVLALATGEVASSNGRRCGYEIVQSVALRDKYPRSTSLPRSRMVKARIFYEQPDGSVVVYNKLIMDAKTRLPDAVTQGMLCRAIMTFWKFVPRCFEMKKLRWCMKNKKSLVRTLQPSSQMLGCAACGIIMRKSPNRSIGSSKSQSDVNHCELCAMWLCGNSYCRSSCQTKMIFCSETKMYEQTLMVCPRCIAFVRSQSGATVARSELVEMQHTPHGGSTALITWEQEACTLPLRRIHRQNIN